MKVITYLEQALESIVYEGLGEWCLPDLEKYSLDKKLFSYQVEAIKNAIKVLNAFYDDPATGKETLYNLCVGEGMKPHLFDVKESDGKNENPKFNRLTNNNSFALSHYNGESIISEKEFFNRTCFWMATASGKTLLIIKMIEILDALQRKKLIPPKEIMVLFPSEKIQEQFAEAVNEYNKGKYRIINLISLKDFDEVHRQLDILDEIKVYSYRSDLFSDVDKTKKIDTVTYDNNGDWYIFMDEAHKGDKEDSLRQDYITIMSRNGFLFNFSATFTDNLDFATTCYNFNLERFIESGYGKNVYLSESKYTFKKKTDDLLEKDKQLQVLKSLITYAIVKKSKKPGYYHNPLMITLVNEVNTRDSDTDLFFAEIAKIATGKINDAIFETAKSEMIAELNENSGFQFGSEQLFLGDGLIEKSINEITVNDLLLLVFNSYSFGKIEVLEGEKGKEFALKLATSDKPFALFRIGDASQYIKEKLNDNYMIIKSYDEKHYFDDLNTESGNVFNILIGSRMFYEGWDSNRPNVMNFINIGTGDAKKFVLQSLGRGVRIEPTANNRKRLKANDSNKEQLLETLFVFATNRNAVETILETMDTQRTNEKSIELRQGKRPFDLLIPYYKDKKRNEVIAKFNISESAYENLKKYVNSYSDELLYILTDIRKEDLGRIRKAMEDYKTLFKFNDSFNYTDMKSLFNRIIVHLSVNDKCVAGIAELGNEIIHFKHIKIAKDKWIADEKELMDFIESDISGSGEDISELAGLLASKKISYKEFEKRVKAAKPETTKIINGVKLIKLSEHYYLPLVLSNSSKLDYIKHIIDVDSEIQFVNNLVGFIDQNGSFDGEWMFSKIDQTIDDRSIAMPYFSTKDNKFHDFYPDFIFWQKKGDDYRITFVDPKGTEHASYLSKVDYFEELFMEGGKAKVFNYKTYKVTFSLKLAYNGEGTIPKKYKCYWFDYENEESYKELLFW